jgi:hypothetical protein
VHLWFQGCWETDDMGRYDKGMEPQMHTDKLNHSDTSVRRISSWNQ